MIDHNKTTHKVKAEKGRERERDIRQRNTENYTYIDFKNTVLKIIFGPTRNEVIQEQKRPCNIQLHGLYFSPDII